VASSSSLGFALQPGSPIPFLGSLGFGAPPDPSLPVRGLLGSAPQPSRPLEFRSLVPVWSAVSKRPLSLRWGGHYATKQRVSPMQEDPNEIDWGEDREAELLARLSSSDPKLTRASVPFSVGARELATALALNTTLTVADLRRNTIGDDGARELAVVLGRNAALKTLDLTHNGIGPAGAGALAAALGVKNLLTTLYLGSNNVGAGGCLHLAAALEKNTILVTLSLDSNNIRDDGCHRLVAALKRNSTLRVLYLHSNNIGTYGAAAFQTLLRSNYTLDEVSGVVGVHPLLARNREIRHARKRKVWWHCTSSLFTDSSPSCVVPCRCGGCAGAEAIQPCA
jgi:hypothetical protein